MSGADVAAIIAGAAAPLAVLAVLAVLARVARWRSRGVTRREVALQQGREGQRQARGRTFSPGNKAATGHASLDWLRPSLDDRDAKIPGEGGAMLRHIDPVVYAPRRMCRACGHSNRMAAYHCARCSAQLRR